MKWIKQASDNNTYICGSALLKLRGLKRKFKESKISKLAVGDHMF